MKILYVHQYFKTPQEGGAIRSYYLGRGLVENGFEVEMITTHNEKDYRLVNVDGIKVHYLPIPYSNAMSMLKRMVSFLAFVRHSRKIIKRINGVDLAYVTSTPLTVGLIGRWMKKKLGIPYIFEVRDLWPIAPIEVGAIKGRLLKKWLFRQEKKIYQSAERIVALSPGMSDWIKKVVPEKKVYIIPNMADCQFFTKEIKNPKLVEFYHANEPFVITYFGSIGTTNHLEFFLDIAEKSLEKGLDVNFKIVGDGGRLSDIKLSAYLRKLSNVDFIRHQNKGGVRDILNISDATYVCFADLPVLATNSPNKLFDSLASGKLTIVNTPGWTKDLVEKYKCGFYTDPNDPENFLAQIKPFLKDRALLDTYKNNARQIAERHYSKKLQVRKLVGVINNEKQIKISDSEVYILTA